MMASPQTVSEALARLQTMSPADAMKSDERERGFGLYVIGQRSWFLPRDWREDAVVSFDRERGEVRIIAIEAKNPGQGAFTRMVRGIMAEGRTPVVIQPMGDMPAILTKWGWQRRDEGEGFLHEEQWRPATPAKGY